MEELNIERKYRRFTDNIKLTLKKAIERDNFELAENIKKYLAYMDKLKLSKKYNYNVEDVENRIKELQNKIIKQQFNENIYNINSITINLPKYEDKNINYIVLFIYKFIEENSDTLCLLTKNIIEQLFKINLLENINVKTVGFKSLYSELSFGGVFASYICGHESDKYPIQSSIPSFNTELNNKSNYRQDICLKTTKNTNSANDMINLTKNTDGTYKLRILEKTEPNRGFGFWSSSSRRLIGDNCDFELNIDKNAIKIFKMINGDKYYLVVGGRISNHKFYVQGQQGYDASLYMKKSLVDKALLEGWITKDQLLFRFYNINSPYNNITKDIIDQVRRPTKKILKICDIFKKKVGDNMINNPINIVYNNSSKNIELKVDKIVYNYNIINKLNYLISKINKYDINKKLEKYEMELSETTIKNYKIMLVVIVLNILKSTNCDDLNMFNLKKDICKYVKLNVKYEINKEYDILHNYLLTRSLSEIDLYKSKNEEISEIIVPKFSIKFMNILVLYLYNFVVENKRDICKNILKLLKYIKKNINKKLNSFNVSGKPYYEDDKIISLCSNDKNAVNLIHTFYSKYNNFDKLLISKLLKKIIENNGLKVKYNKIRDKFTVSIINLEKMDIKLLYTQEIAKQQTIIQKAREKAAKLADKASNIIDKTARLEAEIVAEEALQEVARHESTGQELAAEKTIQETKFMEGFNKDLECIDKYINVKIIKRIFENIVNIINIIIDIITDTKLLGNLLNIKTKKIDYLLKNSKINFSIRKLCVIIFIKLIITTISEYHINPHNVGKYILEDTVNEIHNILCKKIKVNFSYNTRELNESIYTSFPTYDIN